MSRARIKTLINVQPLRLCRLCGSVLWSHESEVCAICPAGEAAPLIAKEAAPTRSPPVRSARSQPDPRCTTLAECIEARQACMGLAGCPPCLRASGTTGNEGAEAT